MGGAFSRIYHSPRLYEEHRADDSGWVSVGCEHVPKRVVVEWHHPSYAPEIFRNQCSPLPVGSDPLSDRATQHRLRHLGFPPTYNITNDIRHFQRRYGLNRASPSIRESKHILAQYHDHFAVPLLRHEVIGEATGFVLAEAGQESDRATPSPLPSHPPAAANGAQPSHFATLIPLARPAITTLLVEVLRQDGTRLKKSEVFIRLDDINSSFTTEEPGERVLKRSVIRVFRNNVALVPGRTFNITAVEETSSRGVVAFGGVQKVLRRPNPNTGHYAVRVVISPKKIRVGPGKGHRWGFDNIDPFTLIQPGQASPTGATANPPSHHPMLSAPTGGEAAVEFARSAPLDFRVIVLKPLSVAIASVTSSSANSGSLRARIAGIAPAEAAFELCLGRDTGRVARKFGVLVKRPGVLNVKIEAYHDSRSTTPSRPNSPYSNADIGMVGARGTQLWRPVCATMTTSGSFNSSDRPIDTFDVGGLVYWNRDPAIRSIMNYASSNPSHVMVFYVKSLFQGFSLARNTSQAATTISLAEGIENISVGMAVTALTVGGNNQVATVTGVRRTSGSTGDVSVTPALAAPLNVNTSCLVRPVSGLRVGRSLFVGEQQVPDNVALTIVHEVSHFAGLSDVADWDNLMAGFTQSARRSLRYSPVPLFYASSQTQAQWDAFQI